MNTQLRRSWHDIRDTLQGRIFDRTYQPGDKLPRDEDIAEELGCARSTVQRAMQDLADAGVVERKRKGGTHVRPDPVTRATLDIAITRVEVEAKGAAYGYQLVSAAREVTPLSVAASFGLSAPEEMLHVQALHLADQRAYVFEDRWVSLVSCAEIEAIDLTRQSANEWLVRNKPYSRCDVRLYAIEADETLAARMDAKAGAALLVIERTTWLNDVPITSVRSVTKPGYQLLTQ
ncbi:GntR family transcriptional regulator [Lentibacter sp.]|uniref:GntR family transcriptional regulator n=1 Tax=Lentibacter sp. TaxID=2024994 RepID=UPI003F6A5D9A